MDGTPVRDPVRAARQRRTRRLAALIGLGPLAVITFSAGSPGAVAETPFEGVARADGVRLSVAARGFLLVEQFSDAGMPGAQAALDSIDSTGYAGAPWPGADTLAVLGLARTNVNKPTGVDAPDYPIAVLSSLSKPEDKKEVGTVKLLATSAPERATGSARDELSSDALSSGRLDADAEVRHDSSGTVVSKGATRAEAIEVAGVLQLGVISSDAQVTATAAGVRTRTSSLAVSDVTIAGQTVGFTDKGFVLAGTTTPIPHDNPLAQVLSDAAVEVQYIDPTTTPDGIISAGVRITAVRDVPELPEPVEVSYEFGRTAAFGTGGSARPSAGTTGGTTGGSTGATTGATTGTSGDGGSGVAATTGGEPVPPPISAGTGELPSGEAGTGVTTPGPVSVGTPDAPAANVGREGMIVDPAMFYLVLALAGAVFVGGVQLLRLFGVRVLWTG